MPNNRRLIVPFATLALSCLFGAIPAQAEPGDIKGQDVKGDREKSANDGFSQAPVPREESAAKGAPNPGGTSTEQNANRPVENSTTDNARGKDPYEPLEHRTPHPSGHNPAQPTR